MIRQINYDKESVMKNGFPKITKLGAVSPNGESTPFVWEGRLYRLELSDPSRGTDPSVPICAIIRDRESGEILSRLGRGCYFYSFYKENGTAYIIGTLSLPGMLCGDTLMIYESGDLIHWSDGRVLFSKPGWKYYNTSLTKGPDGYVLCIEAGEPAEYVGVPFTCFFAKSKDLVSWTLPDPAKGYPKDRYIGGPWLKWSNGYYYLITVEELPCAHYTNYIQRTKDFETWEIGCYNPILMPDENDRRISPYAYDISPELMCQIRNGFLSSNSDIDMCNWQGKTLITYNVGNQLGFYYMAEAEYDGAVESFLESYFE